MLLHYLAKLKTRLNVSFHVNVHVDLPIRHTRNIGLGDDLITVRLLFIHKTIGCVH